MWFVPAIILIAVGIGYLLGGRLRNFERLAVHWWPLAFVGLILQSFTIASFWGLSPRVTGAGALLLSYVLLLAFITVNRWIPGAQLMAIGLLLNLLVVGLNGGMPVTGSAIEAAGGSVAILEDGGSVKHHLATEDDLLTFLGDAIPIPPPAKLVLSIGDVLLYTGMAWFVIQVMRGRSPENPRPLAMWFLSYRGKHAPGHWRMPARYRHHRAEAAPSGTGP